MTVYKQPRGKIFLYDFWRHGERYTGTTGKATKEEALAWERKYRDGLARQGDSRPARSKGST